MARIARIVLPRKAHLVCQGGDRPIFNSAKRRQAYLDILAGCAAVYRVKVLAWSILHKKAYLVVVPPSAEGMSSFMRVVHSRYARFLHAAGLEGRVTPRRFSSCPLDSEAALDAIKFVESRSVSTGLARRPADYPFSSAAVRAKGTGRFHPLLSAIPAITGKVRSWGRWHAVPLDDRRSNYLAMRMRTGKPAGNPRFVRQVEKRVGINLSRGRGRPRNG